MTEAGTTEDAWSLYLWRRYGARIVDTYVLGEPVLFLVLIPAMLIGGEPLLGFIEDEQAWKNLLLFTPLMWIAAIPANAALTHWLGVTPGKWLFGLRVVTRDKARPGFAQLVRREGELFFWGVGLALPLVSLAMMLRSYAEVSEKRAARWDDHAGLVVGARPAKGWQLGGIILGAAIVAVTLLWGLFARLQDMLAV